VFIFILTVLAGTAATVVFCFVLGYLFWCLMERERKRRGG
jgi:hypothetical protein